MGKFKALFSAPDIPDPPPPPPPPPQAAIAAELTDVAAARRAERRRRRAAAGSRSTVLTGPSGLSAPASTAAKTLLGQ